MKKVAVYAVKAAAFLKSAQGKRDIALIVAAAGGVLEAYHRIFG